MIDLGQTITILANIGVIVGILFLAFQLRQSNRIAVAATEIDVRNSFKSINEAIYTDPALAEFLAKTRDPDVNLTAVDRIRIGSILRNLLNAWLALEIAYDNGLVPTETYSIIQDDPRQFMSTFPATLSEWRTVMNAYPGQTTREVFRVVNTVLEEHGL